MRELRGSVLQASLPRLVRRGAWGHARRLLEKSHPADIAQVLDRLTEADCKAVFDLIRSGEIRAAVLAMLESETRARLLSDLPTSDAAEILRHMPQDDAAQVLRELPDEVADDVLTHMGEEGEELGQLLEYPESTAGAIMSPTYIALPAGIGVQEAIERVRRHSDAEGSFYVYVVDDHGALVGVLSLRQLILQPPDKRLQDCMVTNPIRVTTDTDQEEVAGIVARYDLLAVPVVNASNQLVGIVTVDDVIDVLREEATEDLLKLAGTTVEEVTSPGLLRGAWIRIPWLVASFVGGLTGIFLLDRFEGVFYQAVQVAFFLPIILGMGGNVGSQCAMVVVRGLATGQLDPSSIGRAVLHQIGTSVLLASLFALALAGWATWLGYGAPRLPLAVGLGIFASMTTAATIGTLLPILFSRVGADPAIASGPFVTTSSDLMGILTFGSIAGMLI
jgi:magnesium transporter